MLFAQGITIHRYSKDENLIKKVHFIVFVMKMWLLIFIICGFFYVSQYVLTKLVHPDQDKSLYYVVEKSKYLIMFKLLTCTNQKKIRICFLAVSGETNHSR